MTLHGRTNKLLRSAVYHLELIQYTRFKNVSRVLQKHQSQVYVAGDTTGKYTAHNRTAHQLAISQPLVEVRRFWWWLPLVKVRFLTH